MFNPSNKILSCIGFIVINQLFNNIILYFTLDFILVLLIFNPD